MTDSDPLNPSPALLAVLGSAVVHADEYLSRGGHPFDKTAFDDAMAAPLLVEWIEAMRKIAMVPECRT